MASVASHYLHPDYVQPLPNTVSYNKLLLYHRFTIRGLVYMYAIMFATEYTIPMTHSLTASIT